MRIVSIGHNFLHQSVTQIAFNSNDSLLDFDCILWNPNKLFSEYGTGANLTEGGYWQVQSYFQLKLEQAIERRQREMQSLLSQNRTIVIATPLPMKYRASQSIAEILDALPIQGVYTNVGSGKRIESKADEKYTKFLRANHQSLKYEVHFEEYPGQPLFYITGTNNVVAFKAHTENGLLLFLPFPENETDEQINKTYINSVRDLIYDLKSQNVTEAPPEWTDLYRFDAEETLKKALLDEEILLQKLQAEIDLKKQNISKLEQLKHLFAGSGKSLEKQVETIFTELGFQIKKVQDNRDDLIAEFNGKAVVIEVKGVSKSAKEGNAAQLEKWVSEYQIANNVTPKGILIVNAFKDKKLAERIEDAFPHQMLDYSIKRDHCLITGLQLFGLYLDYLSNPEQKQALIDKLFNTIGVFEGYDDWAKFLTQISDIPAS
jgi:hypothetical protein